MLRSRRSWYPLGYQGGKGVKLKYELDRRASTTLPTTARWWWHGSLVAAVAVEVLVVV